MPRYLQKILVLLMGLCLLACGCTASSVSSGSAVDKTALASLLSEFSVIPQNREQMTLVNAYYAVFETSSSQKEVDDAVNGLKQLKKTIMQSPMSFVDGGVETAVRTALGIEAGTPITVADCFGLESLDASDEILQPVRFTYDFRYFPNLRSLSLLKNEVRDLTGLTYLTKLESLSLSMDRNRTVNYAVLGTLPLKQLTLQSAGFESLEAFPSIPTLERFSLISCAMNDVRDISLRFPSLAELELDDCPLSEGDPLGECIGIHTMDLSGTPLFDLSFLIRMESLQVLRLSGVSGVDFSPLSQVPHLSRLDLSDCRIEDTEWLHSFPSLTALDLSSNNLSSLSAASDLPALSTLDLSGNKLTEFTLSSALSNVINVDLSGNQLREFHIDAPGGCALSTLDLSDNQLQDVDLSGCSALTGLDLRGNDLRNFTLSSESLLRLDLSGNPLISFSVVAPSLTELYLSEPAAFSREIHLSAPQLNTLSTGGAGFPSIDFLVGCPLKVLSLDVRKIEDIAPLSSFSDLTDLSLIGADESVFDVLRPLTGLVRLTFVEGSFEYADVSELPLLSQLTFDACTSLDNLSLVRDLPSLTDYTVSGAVCTAPQIYGFPQLTRLTLDHCGVRSLSGVRDLPQLTTLSLQGNGIVTLSVIGYPSLRSVDLNSNNINSWDACIFDMTEGLVDLRNNPCTPPAQLSSALTVLFD